MAKKRKFDSKEVGQAARGLWPDIIAKIGGVDPAYLDGDHHPCPKCGGSDRFRAFKDFAETGGMICNQCHPKENGDGFSSIQWLTGLSFGDALAKVADYLGIQGKDEKDPAKDLEWRTWNTGLAAFYFTRKGVSEESLLANGAKMAIYKKDFTVIAIPIIGEGLDLEHPVGWVVVPTTSETLPKWDQRGAVVGHVKMKITYGSRPGFIGTHAAARLARQGLVEKVWKVEGLSDMLALYDKIPAPLRDREIVVTNSNGAGETPRWQAGIIATAPACRVLHDADDPGQAGAENWAQAIAAQQAEGRITTRVILPYPIAADHGKDLRDWFAEGNQYSDLCMLVEKGVEVSVAKTETGDIDISQQRFPMQELLFKKLQMEVLYEDENNAVRIYSAFTKKSSTIKDVERLKHNHLIQMCGNPAIVHVTADNPDGVNTFSMADVRRAITMFAAPARGRGDEKGVGIWQGKTRYGHLNETVVLVNKSASARYNGDKILRRVETARAEGLLLDMGSAADDWFDFETMEKHLASAENLDWRAEVIGMLESHLEQWVWRNPDVAPALVTGLALASWTQTIWLWRPMVSITGESNAGKSMLFDFLFGEGDLRGLFGTLAYRSDESTAAGIIQKIGNSARILAIDEFERSSERDKILKALRSSSRGGKQTQGSSQGKAVERQLRHIAWVAAIETGLRRQPDMNRFIQLGLMPAEAGKHGKLRIPSSTSLESLGHKLLAIAIRGAIRAKQLASELKSVQVEGVDGRSVESYAVPAAALAIALDFDQEKAEKLLRRLLENVDRSEQGQTDQLDLLNDSILGSKILTGMKHGQLSIAQILESPHLITEYRNNLEAFGVKLTSEGQLFIAHNRVARGILKGSQWENQRIDEILLRLPAGPDGKAPSRKNLRVAGSMTRGILLPAFYTPQVTPEEPTEAPNTDRLADL